ncbi:uncharacterized protein EV422DRAFT_529448 [Fimicolochytrium jonesii]|uniref:uncharacterized protein n=1 Tax=Fimicolochytrium jonesii TaxID=1396493 RepID=UPI0022FE5500|nr:uncharacterized protein EV422DRAFT_529448 [Fimicolochytrium jonesii]KAI8821165.1 hypothetical protein EV422DRAFT_529448 [Fimicolochytrium jonesii]
MPKCTPQPLTLPYGVERSGNRRSGAADRSAAGKSGGAGRADEGTPSRPTVRAPTPADAQPTTLHIPSPAGLLTLPVHRNLWHLHLTIHPLTAHHLTALSNFTALGLLNLSYTDVDFGMLQNSLRGVVVFRLWVVGCGRLVGGERTAVRGAEGGTDVGGEPDIAQADRRGFLLTSLPRIWSLDGVVVTWRERRLWGALAESCGYAIARGVKAGVRSAAQGVGLAVRSRFVDLVRKEFVPLERGWHAKENDDRVDPVLSASQQARITSPTAHTLLATHPHNFTMGVEEDLARLRVLCKDVELSLHQSGLDVDGLVTEVVLGGDDLGKIKEGRGGTWINTPGITTRTTLLLLLLASFFPKAFLNVQSTFETLFGAGSDHAAGYEDDGAGVEDREGTERHWTTTLASPITWCVRDRLALLGLLVARGWIDHESETSKNPHTPLLPANSLHAITRFSQVVLASTLAHTEAGAAPVTSTSMGARPASAGRGASAHRGHAVKSVSHPRASTRTEPKSTDTPKPTTLYIPQLRIYTHRRALARLQLDILQLCCLDERNDPSHSRNSQDANENDGGVGDTSIATSSATTTSARAADFLTRVLGPLSVVLERSAGVLLAPARPTKRGNAGQAKAHIQQKVPGGQVDRAGLEVGGTATTHPNLQPTPPTSLNRPPNATSSETLRNQITSFASECALASTAVAAGLTADSRHAHADLSTTALALQMKFRLCCLCQRVLDGGGVDGDDSDDEGGDGAGCGGDDGDI